MSHSLRVPIESGTNLLNDDDDHSEIMIDSADDYKLKFLGNRVEQHVLVSNPTNASTNTVGSVFASTVKFDVTDGHDSAVGTSTGTVEIPAGAVILDIQVVSTVLWDAGTSTTLIVGDDDDPNGWFDAVDLQAGGSLLVGETLSAAASGDGTNGAGRWGGVNGAYLVEATGRMGRTTAGVDSGNYMGAATEVIGAVTTVGTVPTTGTTYMTVFWVVASQTAATYVAT